MTCIMLQSGHAPDNTFPMIPTAQKHEHTNYNAIRPLDEAMKGATASPRFSLVKSRLVAPRVRKSTPPNARQAFLELGKLKEGDVFVSKQI